MLNSFGDWPIDQDEYFSEFMWVQHVTVSDLLVNNCSIHHPSVINKREKTQTLNY